MANKHIFTGTAKWARLFKPDPKYGNYTIDVYLDDKSKKAYVKAGCRMKFREDAEGVFVTFRRNPTQTDFDGAPRGAPRVVGPDGEVFDQIVGNGSEVSVLCETYDTKSGLATRLNAVRVDKHVPFVGKEYDLEEAF